MNPEDIRSDDDYERRAWYVFARNSKKSQSHLYQPVSYDRKSTCPIDIGLASHRDLAAYRMTGESAIEALEHLKKRNFETILVKYGFSRGIDLDKIVFEDTTLPDLRSLLEKDSTR